MRKVLPQPVSILLSKQSMNLMVSQASALKYAPGYYAAFLYDPDGNNIEAVYRR
ncbi:hypothetical protein [Zooshikella harenae]|uniref:VOC domain-containing protein n=1 Tax=Zooshikella harenae TaxID=2827238 RepID=A0ABS5ZIA8_9GAMM|nr:hypothetical protein [Zooshikella harenae]MBU2713777.1 hypothetical protein [Zooshikella harenae]